MKEMLLQTEWDRLFLHSTRNDLNTLFYHLMYISVSYQVTQFSLFSLTLFFILFSPSFLPSFIPSFLPSFLASLPASFFLPCFLRCFHPSYILPFFLHSFLASFLPCFLACFLPSLLASFLACFLASLLPPLPPCLLPSFLRFLMCPLLLSTFQAVIRQISNSYSGYAQMSHIVSEWLCLASELEGRGSRKNDTAGNRFPPVSSSLIRAYASYHFNTSCLTVTYFISVCHCHFFPFSSYHLSKGYYGS